MDNLLAVLLGYVIPGIAIAAGILLIMTRFPKKTRLWLYGHPLLIEVGGLWLAWEMHGGTIVGGMAVVIAGVAIWATMSACRYLFGYISGGKYHRRGMVYEISSLGLDKPTETATA